MQLYVTGSLCSNKRQCIVADGTLGGRTHSKRADCEGARGWFSGELTGANRGAALLGEAPSLVYWTTGPLLLSAPVIRGEKSGGN